MRNMAESTLYSQTWMSLPTSFKESKTLLSISIDAIEGHVTSAVNLFKSSAFREHRFTPSEIKKLYRTVVSMGSINIRVLNALVDAGVSLSECPEILEDVVEYENLEAVELILRAGAKPTPLTIEFAVDAVDFVMMDKLLEYGASRETLKSNLEACLNTIKSDLESYTREYHNIHIVEDIQAYLESIS